MIDMAKTPEELAIAKLQEIIEKAVDSEADSITIEYAKEGGLEVCFMFGPMGQYYIDNGIGREISLEEALEIQSKAQEAGLVTQPATAQNPFTMCNCCEDCCGVLTSISSHPRPPNWSIPTIRPLWMGKSALVAKRVCMHVHYQFPLLMKN